MVLRSAAVSTTSGFYSMWRRDGNSVPAGHGAGEHRPRCEHLRFCQGYSQVNVVGPDGARGGCVGRETKGEVGQQRGRGISPEWQHLAHPRLGHSHGARKGGWPRLRRCAFCVSARRVALDSSARDRQTFTVCCAAIRIKSNRFHLDRECVHVYSIYATGDETALKWLRCRVVIARPCFLLSDAVGASTKPLDDAR